MSSRGLAAALMAVLLVFAAVTPFFSGSVEANGFAGGHGTVGDPYQIENVVQLQAMKDDLSAHYVLIADIDASATAGWNDEAGFEPIGDEEEIFMGTFDGDGHTISNLFINRTLTNTVGLFGAIAVTAEIKNIALIDLNVNSGNDVGGLAGKNWGTVSESYASGNVSGNERVGGLIGENWGSVTLSYAACDVSGSFRVGGIVGYNRGTVSESYSTGDVSGTASVGGLVGFNFNVGYVSESYATGDVSGVHDLGGLVAWNQGNIAESYATGDVSGGDTIGGLVAWNEGDITESYATGDVSGTSGFSSVGGLVGNNEGDIRKSHATGNATGNNYVGALVAWNEGDITESYATGDVSGASNLGGLAGSNIGTIHQSYSTANVHGDEFAGGLVGRNTGIVNLSFARGEVSGADWMGGLVGWNEGTVAEAYASGDVDGNDVLGGLIGGNDGTVTESYATGKVNGSNWVGGLIGDNQGSVAESYATGKVNGSNWVGGLIGIDDGTVTRSYWDNKTTDQTVSDGGDGKTAEEMMLQTTFVDWDFDDVWWMTDGETRPFLRMEWSTEIRNSHQLQLMAMDLEADYVLMNDIDLSDIKRKSSMWGTDASTGGGFQPIGNQTDQFSGSLDGKGHLIHGLFINRSTTEYVGMFSHLSGMAEITDVGLVDFKVVGLHHVGGLVGLNTGSISQISAVGNVSGINGVGGLVGSNQATISSCSASVGVSGTNQAGGLVGSSIDGATISESYATGDVSGNDYVAGLVGNNEGMISESYATGDVSGNNHMGGLVGINSGTVRQSHATGDVSGNNQVGGLIGWSYNTIYRSYAAGNVSGHAAVGGLVGYTSAGTISVSFATGDVSATHNQVGGLVGNNIGSISQTYATGDVSGNWYVGGLVGENQNEGSIIQSYSVGEVSGLIAKGLVGFNWGLVSQSYWDTQTSNQPDSNGGEGRTTEEMMRHSTFVSWDFVDVWWIAEGATYPLLSHFINFTVAAISIEHQPELKYDYGEELDLTLLKVNMTWSDGSVIINSIVKHKDFQFYQLESDPSNGTEVDHGYDGVTVGVTHTPSNEKAYTEEMVINRIVTAVWLVQEPDILTYDYGQALDLTGLAVNLTWSDTGNETIEFEGFGAEIVTDPVDGAALSHTNTSVTVTHVASNESDGFGITVNAVVTSIAIEEQPQLSYVHGEELDLSELVVNLTWSDGTFSEISFVDFEANGLVADPQNGTVLESMLHNNTAVKVTYDGELEAFTNDIVIAPVVTAIAVEVQPQLEYEHGQALDLTLMVANMTWSDGTFSIVAFADFADNGLVADPDAIDPLDHGTEGSRIAVIHGASGEMVYTDEITVISVVTVIAIEEQPLLLYSHGDELDLSSMVANMTWSDGSWSLVPFADFEANDISVSIDHGTSLTVDDHHGLAVEVAHGQSGLSDETEALSVVPEAIDEAPIDDDDDTDDDDICPLPLALMLVLGMSAMVLRRR